MDVNASKDKSWITDFAASIKELLPEKYELMSDFSPPKESEATDQD